MPTELPQDRAAQMERCLESANDAERLARETGNDGLRRDYELLAQSWRRLAQSHQYSGHLDQVLEEVRAALRRRGPGSNR
ncbi:hypothetical protein [Bradyrhizobium ivorense]|uniref:hypothetical protein n=1 Tax=Bradyrhizobium ivorense TaxID=2511166 RepID=UPI0011175E6F|nr:hypothetical protein [Bradyrhizobium ivorense]